LSQSSHWYIETHGVLSYASSWSPIGYTIEKAHPRASRLSGLKNRYVVLSDASSWISIEHTLERSCF
jgi:hypothetical protein